MSSKEPVYCLCGQPYDPERFMIQCDVCKDWFHGRQASVADDDDDDDGNDNDVVKINISGNTNNDSNTKKHHHHHQQQQLQQQKHQVDVKQLRPAGAAGQNLRQQATTTGAPSSDIGACDSRGWSTTNTTTTTATPSAVTTTTATPSAVTTTTATPSAVTTTTGLVIDAGDDNHLNNSDARSAGSIIIGPTPPPRSACLLSTRGGVNGGGVSNTATTTTTMTATTPTIVASCTNSTTPAGVVSVTTVCSSPSSRSRRATDEAEQSKGGDGYGLLSLSTGTATAQAHELLSNLDGPDQRLLLGVATAATLASPSPNSTVELASMSEREASTEATASAAATTTATSTTAAATTTTAATSTTVTTSATTTTATTNTTAAVVAAAEPGSLVRGLADGAPPRHHDETSRAHPSERSETCGVVTKSHVDDLDKPASTMPPLPPSTTLLDEQIAGHRHGHGKTKLGLLRHADGSILKPLVPNDVRAKREHDFYLFMEQHRKLCRARPAEYNNSSNNNDNNSNNNDNHSSSSNNNNNDNNSSSSNNNNDKNNTDRHDGAGSQTVDNATCLCDDPILHQLMELTPRYLGVFETAYPDQEDTDQDIDQGGHDETHDDVDDDALVSVESASQTAATSTAAAVASGDAGAATKTITTTAADAAGGSQQRPRRRQQQQQQQKQQCHPTSHEVAYMKLADLCRDFGRPCIADVKIGRVVHDPEATADKIEQSVSKYPAQYDIGYRILGMRVFGDDGRCRVYDANFGLQQTPASVADAIKTFMDANPGCVRPIVGQLERIMAWFERQRRYAFYSSSILIVYDAIEPRAAVKLIDFAHVFPTDRPDDNYMFGLARLISDFRAAIPPPA